MNLRICVSGILVSVLGASGLQAAPLTDSQLFFDPTELPAAFYPSQSIGTGGVTIFNSQPGRTIVGANILPILMDNLYSPGYAFSQSDYATQPNQLFGPTYSADLTDGILTAQFDDNGAYHLRLNYSDGFSEVHSVFVDAGIGTAYDGADAPNKASPWRAVPAKEADLYIISTGAGTDGFINSAVALLGTGANTARAATVAEAKAAIEARKTALGRKITVAVIGHGYQGSIRLGFGDDAERINNSGAANSTGGAAFGNMIKDFVTSVNLFGCNTGGGVAGGQLLADIEGTGVAATAYTSTVGLTNEKWFAYTWGTKVPAPGSIAIGALGMMLIARRRRAA